MPRRTYAEGRPRPHVGNRLDIDWLISLIAQDRAKRKHTTRPPRNSR